MSCERKQHRTKSARKPKFKWRKRCLDQNQEALSIRGDGPDLPVCGWGPNLRLRTHGKEARTKVSAVPRFGEDVGLEQVLFRMVLGEAEGRGLTPAAQTCADIYVNATGKYGDKLANATTACEEAADRTNGANTQVTNATINQIRVQLLTLEQNLQLCRNETDSAVFLNCTVTSFDKNLQLLDTSNSQAYRAKSQFVSNATQVNAEKSNCISSAVSEAKVQSIQAANDFNSCLDKIPTQREVPQQKEQQKKELQLTQVPKEQVSQIPQQKFEDLPLTN